MVSKTGDKIRHILGLKVGKQVAKMRNTLGLIVGITGGENTEYAGTEGG